MTRRLAALFVASVVGTLFVIVMVNYVEHVQHERECEKWREYAHIAPTEAGRAYAGERWIELCGPEGEDEHESAGSD